MMSLTKNPNPPGKKIFFRVQTRRLAASFDASTRSVTWTGAEILVQSHKHLGVIFLKIPESSRTPKS